MWKLTLDDTIRNDYLEKMLPDLIKRIQAWKGEGSNGRKITLDHIQFRKRLLPDYNEKNPKEKETLVKLLIAKPDEAYRINNSLMKQFIRGYNESELAKKKLPDKYITPLKILESIFDYNGQISKSKSKSYWIAERIGRNTCTYCNRQYTFTINGKNDAERISRPAFDHWFPKSLFPLLSLNIYNLIPCCTVCNSGAKGSTIFKLDTHIHPYMQEDDDPDFKFIPQVSDQEGSWNVVLSRDPVQNPMVDNTIKAFGLDQIYNMHGNLEVKDLIEFAQAYNPTYLKNIFEKMKKDYGSLGYSQEDVYRILFGTEALASLFLDRPLSKLKHDLLKYLQIIS